MSSLCTTVNYQRSIHCTTHETDVEPMFYRMSLLGQRQRQNISDTHNVVLMLVRR